MIEIAFKPVPGYSQTILLKDLDWHELPKISQRDGKVRFDVFYYRINDEIYLQETPAFREAYNKEILFLKLKG